MGRHGTGLRPAGLGPMIGYLRLPTLDRLRPRSRSLSVIRRLPFGLELEGLWLYVRRRPDYLVSRLPSRFELEEEWLYVRGR